jgi:predicted lipoprotein with Yx(FWY)xxD motif
MTRYASMAVFLLLALGVAACGGDDSDEDSAATTPVQTETTTTEQASGTTIQVEDSEFGQVLFDSERMPIYLFDKEKGEQSECYGECATAWPPVLSEGMPVAGNGVKENLLGTTKRRDGKTQVTYNGHPLYYYEDDRPGEILCQNVSEFGGLWLVVTPNGEAVRES